MIVFLCSCLDTPSQEALVVGCIFREPLSRIFECALLATPNPIQVVVEGWDCPLLADFFENLLNYQHGIGGFCATDEFLKKFCIFRSESVLLIGVTPESWLPNTQDFGYKFLWNFQTTGELCFESKKGDSCAFGGFQTSTSPLPRAQNRPWYSSCRGLGINKNSFFSSTYSRLGLYTIFAKRS